MPTSPQPDPPGRSAASTLSWSWPLIEPAALCIQNTIDVSTVAAINATAPSKNSCWACGNSALARSSPMPSARHSTMASATPAHTDGSVRARPVWAR